MSIIKCCPRCGEPLNSDGSYCPYCEQTVECVDSGDAISSQSHVFVSDDYYFNAQLDGASSSVMAPYKPNDVQTIAGVLMVTGFLGPILFFFLQSFFSELIWSLTDFQQALIFLFIPAALSLIGTILLIWKASNMAIRVAAVGFMVYFLTRLFWFLFNMLPQPASGCLSIMVCLGGIYSLSLVFGNSQLSSDNKVWISLLCVICSMDILTAGLGLGQFLFYEEESFYSSVLYDFFMNYILGAFYAISIWKLARCEAFSGIYDAAHDNDFSPQNKWMAMSVIYPIVTGLALYFYYFVIIK